MAALAISPDPSNRRLSGGNRRLSGGGRRLSGWRPEDVENFFEENDDDKEREAAAAQRKAEQMAKEKTRSPFRATPGHEKRRQIYTDCIQMAAEDRVNAQNSWHLDLIDHMGHMIAEPSADASGQPNFQMASTTLDAGVKIYSYRVDSVFNQTFKLVGGLNRSDRRKEDGEDAADDAMDAGEGGEGEAGTEGAAGADDEKKKKVSAKKAAAAAAAAAAGTAHLEENVDKLNLTNLDVSFDVDPLFHRTSAKFDEGGANGLLLNNLSVQHGCELVFDSSDGLTDAASVQSAPSPPLPAAALAGLLPTGAATGHVAKEFVDFWASVNGTVPVADDGDDECDEPEEEPENEAEEEPALTIAPALEDYADDEAPDYGDDDYDELVAEKERMVSELEVASEDTGDTAAALFVVSPDEFKDENSTVVESEVLAPEVAAARGLLSAQAQKLLHVGQRWAGPGHWKFRAPAASAKAAGGGGGDAGKGRKAKAAFLVDFSQGARLAEELESASAPAKGSTQLTAAARAKAKATDTTLPHDYHCSVDALEALFDRPTHRVSYAARRLMRKATSSEAATVQSQESAEGFDGSNADDDYDPGFGIEDDDSDPVPQEQEAFEAGLDNAPAPSGSSFADDLVAAPQRVEKIDIGYAKRAKQVDIKGLKEDVWALLQEEAQGSAKGKTAAPREVSFQQVLSRLHERMHADKLEEVSFAYCFICLLHLANEKSLEVLGDGGDMKDMRVRLPTAK